MKKYYFTFYGLVIGALCAVFGSIGFSVVVIAILAGIISDPTIFLASLGDGILYSAMFSVIPGALGGAYLARWLEKSERAPREIARHSLLVGALAGLVASLAFMEMVLQLWTDWMTYAFAALAIAVAAGAGFLAAKFLARKKGKFVPSNPLP